MPTVGVSLSDTHIRIVTLQKRSGNFVLSNYASKELPQGALEAGYVHKPKEIVEILKQLKKEFGLKFVEATLPEEKAFVYQTNVPKGTHAEMRNAVEISIEENVPIIADEAVFDFAPLPHDEQTAETVRVIVTVVPLKVVETYLDLFTQAGLFVTAFELESQAIARAIVPQDDTNTYLVINCERFKTGFYVAAGNSIRFTSTITATTADITQISTEIDKIYWHLHSEHKGGKRGKIFRIILVGEGAMNDGVREHIFSTVGIGVELGNVWQNVFTFDNYVPDIPLKESLPYAAAVGLALRITNHD